MNFVIGILVIFVIGMAIELHNTQDDVKELQDDIIIMKRIKP